METPKRFFGQFFGADLGRDACDVLAIQHIPAKLRAEEPELYGKKWFDYRRMHPVIATYLFAHQYSEAYSRMTVAVEDFERGKFKRGVKTPDFFESREKLSFWRLRQFADLHGIRYDFFMREAMNWCIARGWRQPPRPAHIYSNADMILDVLNAWTQECRAKLQYPKDDHFQIESWCGAQDQLAYEQWLLDQIATRRVPRFALHAAVYVEGVLRVEAAIERFGYEAVSAATDYCLEEICQG